MPASRDDPGPPAGPGTRTEGGLHGDVLDSEENGRPVRWPRWTGARRRAAVTVGLLAAGGGALWLAADRATSVQRERALRDRIAVTLELDVDASSTASGGGRVDYSAVVRNDGPRPVRVLRVVVMHPWLRATGRPQHPGRQSSAAGHAAHVRPGGVAYVPLSVQLDCRRTLPATGVALAASVAVVTAGGRSAEVTAPVRRPGPLLTVAAALCGLDPELRLPELSGPVVPRPDG